MTLPQVRPDVALEGDDKAANLSDDDMLVAFDGPATSKRFYGVRCYLEALQGCPVDLATEKAPRPELRPYFERERVLARTTQARMAVLFG